MRILTRHDYVRTSLCVRTGVRRVFVQTHSLYVRPWMLRAPFGWHAPTICRHFWRWYFENCSCHMQNISMRHSSVSIAIRTHAHCVCSSSLSFPALFHLAPQENTFHSQLSCLSSCIKQDVFCRYISSCHVCWDSEDFFDPCCLLKDFN